MNASPDRTAAPPARPVGRPSKVAERTEQILAAVEKCIIDHGVEGTTLSRIAEAAGLQRSLIHHYVGTRDALLRAVAARAASNVNELVDRSVPTETEAQPEAQLSFVIALLFGPEFQAPEIAYLIDELAVVGRRDETVRAELGSMYAGFIGSLADLVAAVHPDASTDDVRTVAHTVVGLAESAARFGEYGFDPHNYPRMESAARHLIDGLAG